MLMTIRDKAQGWIAWAIVILISIPFALWGIQEYLGVGSEPIAVKVNDREITQQEIESASVRLRVDLREQLGASYDAELFPESMLRQQVLEGLIRDTLIQQAADDLGLRTGDGMIQQTILGIEAFQVNGRFDQQAYRRAVQLQGLTEQGFEERLRNTLVSSQLQEAIAGSAFTSRAEAELAQRLGNQTRKLSYVTLTSAQLAAPEQPSDADIEAYYQNNAALLMSEERVKLEYLLLNADAIIANLVASDDELREYYETQQEAFVTPDRKRISHILFEVADDTDEQALNSALQAAEGARLRLEQGTAFAELAAELSQDIASAAEGGDLGFLEPGLFDPAFEAAASELQQGEISAPVRTRFGYHLLTVTEQIDGNRADFASVRDQVKQRFLRDEAEQIFFDYAERLGNLSYESPDSLEPAAEELKLPLQETDWIPRSGGDGMFAEPKVLGAAFSEEALTQGYNSEPLELSPTEIIVLRVVEHQVAARKPLAEVKPQIIDSLQAQQAMTQLNTMAEEWLEKLRAGSSLAALAEARGVSIEAPGFIPRVGGSVAETISEKLFAMNRPAAGNTAYASAQLDDGSVVVLALAEVRDGDANNVGSASAQLASMLSRQQGREEFELYVESLRRSANIEYIAFDAGGDGQADL